MDSPVASADERKQHNTAQYLIYTKIIIHPINPCFEFSSSHRVLGINAISTLLSLHQRSCFELSVFKSCIISTIKTNIKVTFLVRLSALS